MQELEQGAVGGQLGDDARADSVTAEGDSEKGDDVGMARKTLKYLDLTGRTADEIAGRDFHSNRPTPPLGLVHGAEPTATDVVTNDNLTHINHVISGVLTSDSFCRKCVL